MCSVTEDVMDSNLTPTQTLIVKDSMCRSCKEKKAQVLLRKTDPYCSTCFISYAGHKFRSTLGKARAVKPNELVLLSYSGGFSSGCMVKFVQHGIEEAGKQKRLLFKPSVLYIDEGALLGLTDVERQENYLCVANFIKSCSMELYATSLEYCMASSPSAVEVANGFICNKIHEEHLKSLFNSVKSLTAREDLLFHMKCRLIAAVAEKLGYQKIFLASTSTRLASQLLTSMAQGRGAQIGDEVGFTDTRHKVTFLRPMREFFDREVAYLSRMFHVESLGLPSLSSKVAAQASIGRLTEEFILKLQMDFPSTVSTLFRTGDKLKACSKNNDHKEENGKKQSTNCAICQSKIENSAECNAFSARIFSQKVSQLGPLQFDISSICQQSNPSQPCINCHCRSTEISQKPFLATEELNGTLCYGCRVTMEDLDKPELLPESLKDDIHQRIRLEKMRQSVEQFLL